MPPIYSPTAKRELAEIWYYVALNSESAADRLVEQIKAQCELLNLHPGLGEACDYYAPGLRRFHIGQYVVFFRRLDHRIEIAHVLHGARDIDSLF
jgi:toxin ParE1/3/4